MTTDKKPWFLLMRPEDANRLGSGWVRAGAASRGKIVMRPIAPAGWIVLVAFVVSLPLGIAALGEVLYALFGVVSRLQLIVAIVVLVLALTTGFGLLIRSRTTRLPPKDRRAE